MRVFLKSYGCAANLADGEVLAGCLRQAGVELAEGFEVGKILSFVKAGIRQPGYQAFLFYS